MMIKQRELTEKLLFDYFMISSFREDEVYSPYPFYISKEIFEAMVDSALTLNGIVLKIMDAYLEKPDAPPFQMAEFPFMDRILSLNCSLPPFFWARYDVFVREDGGIFFSEFNYDKPCAQREIAVSDILQPHGNPNTHFETAFRDYFKQICKNIFDKNEKTGVVILVSPFHDEEVHLAHFYMDLLHDLNCNFVIAGTDNIYVKDNMVWAFDQKIDIILRQFPTEFLHEIEDLDKILQLYENGNVMIVNDPRVMIAQTKRLFAYLWDMVHQDSPFLTAKEKDVIRKTIPFTYLFEGADVSVLEQQREALVIKAVYGRYSEQVYIGCLYTQEEWSELIQEVAKSGEPHIVQQFCKIKRDEVLQYNGEAFVQNEAYGNIGIYLSKNEFVGTCVRWSPDYLSSDDFVWVSPVGVKERTISITNMTDESNQQSIWQTVNDKAAFQNGFTGGYTGVQQSFSLQSLILDKDCFEEIKTATERLLSIFNKTTDYVLQNHELLCPILGISDSISNMLKEHPHLNGGFVGRFDWVFDSIGNLKLLEFNSETPAGLMESIVLSSLILKETGQDFFDPNENMKALIKQRFLDITREYEKKGPVKTIGIVSLAYAEDWYNTQLLYEIIQDCNYHFVNGEVSGLVEKNGKLLLYDQPLDAVYRYYPLDWFDKDPYYKGIINAFSKGTCSINPPASILSQSKAFFALVWELLKIGFYSKQESQLIEKYLPFTSLDPHDFPNNDYCAKPCFGREGEGVHFSILNTKKQDDKSDLIYQQRIEIQPVNLQLNYSFGNEKINAYPILGAFVIGDQYGGIYTRAGGIVTDQWAVYVPTYFKDLGEQA